MEINKKIEIAKKILENSSYQTQKDRIKEIFNNSEDIILRLIVIDSCYSTNMNRRLFAFEDMRKLIEKLSEYINIGEFIKQVGDLKEEKIGIDKKGKPRGHGISLLTKYLYFQRDFDFPIYDGLVYTELIEQRFLEKPKQFKPTKEYFKKLQELKKLWKRSSFDELDKYFWVCGKIRKGSLSLLVKDKEEYERICEELDIFNSDEKKSSKSFDNFIKIKLNTDKEYKNEKLILIKHLFDEEIKNNK